MSKAFTKEDDNGAETLPDLPQSPHPNYVTPEGLAALQDMAHLPMCRISKNVRQILRYGRSLWPPMARIFSGKGRLGFISGSLDNSFYST